VHVAVSDVQIGRLTPAGWKADVGIGRGLRVRAGASGGCRVLYDRWEWVLHEMSAGQAKENFYKLTNLR